MKNRIFNEKNFDKNMKYVICVLAMLILMMGAIAGPKVLFFFQDRYRMDNTWQGKRSSINMDALNNSYEALSKRLAGFADGLEMNKTYYVTGTEYEVTQDFFSFLEQFYEQEQTGYYIECGMLPTEEELYSVGFSVDEWKKYVIFEEGNASVVLMAWYIELAIDENDVVRMLVDSENYTVYYIQHIIDNQNEWESYIIVFPYFADYVSMYYEADQSGEAYESDPIVENKQYDANTQSDIEDIKYAIKNGNSVSIVKMLTYGEYNLDLEMGIDFANDYEGNKMLYIGIREIKELIPEMKD